jgi:ribosomal protein S5
LTGFEVNIIHREQVGNDPHPIRLSDEDEDFWVAQTRRANVLLDSPGFSAVTVASNGSMERMNTVHPATFVAFKRWMSTQTEREAIKRRRDALQADAVQELVVKYLPQS